MENTGMYFVGRCSFPSCSYYNAPTTLYIGRGRSFDFVKERRQCMCGQCFSAITDILYVFFYKCRWSYMGQLLGCDQRVTEADRRTTDVEYFPMEKQILNWKWLKFTVYDDTPKELPNSQATQTFGDLSGVSVSVQTEQPEQESAEDKVISEEVVDSLLQRVRHYELKYRNLKQAAKECPT